jgi:hypothetical protein
MSKINLVEGAIARIEENTTKRQMEAAKLLFSAQEGDLSARYKLMEGISSSDIPTLLQPAIQVQFLAKYAALPNVWNQIAEEKQVDDFGTIKFGTFDVDPTSLSGNEAETFVNGGLPVVGEYDEYPAMKYTTTTLDKTFERKRGARARLSWESLRRVGNFDIIGEFTSKFAELAARQEDIALARLFVTAGAAGVGSAFTGKTLAANSGLSTTANPALSLTALQAALAQSTAARVNGNPVGATSYKLVYGSALATTVANLMSIQTIRRTDGNGTYDINANSVTGPFRPIEFNAMDTVSGSNTNAYWFVIPESMTRPQFYELFLTGERTPLISIKDSGHMSLAGGEVPVREGSFDEDDVQTRVRHIVDAVNVTNDGFVVSTGAGS